MFVFGHLGIGSTIAKPWSRGISRRVLLLGTILPDLIDKPTYYLLVLFTGKHSQELGMLAGTRLFGHTALFLALLLAAAFFWKRRRALFAALALGVATHLLLDNVADALLGDHSRSALIAMTWPWFGWNFPAIPFHSIGAHLRHSFDPRLLACEGLGLVLLAWDFWRKIKFRRTDPA